MNLSPFADAPFGDEDSFNDFLGAHDIAHTTIASRLISVGFLVNSVPLADTPRGNPDWMQDHYQIHVEIGSALNQSVPDLSSVDMDDENQYLDWMELHRQLHEQINSLLGINT